MKYTRNISPHYILTLIILILVFSYTPIASAQVNTYNRSKNTIYSDTLGVGETVVEISGKTSAFYDTLMNNKNWFLRNLTKLVVKNNATKKYGTVKDIPISTSLLSQEYFQIFNGKTIADIQIYISDISDTENKIDPNWGERTLDKLHNKTDYNVIKKNLLFEIGDTFNSNTMQINEQFLRAKPYLTSAYFIITNDPYNPNGVIVKVYTRDTWTISVDGSWSSRPYIAVYDKNFIGRGNMLKAIYRQKYKYQDYGAELQYAVNNLFGTFANATFNLGFGNTNNTAEIIINKEYILPGKSIWGAQLGYRTENRHSAYFDSTYTVKQTQAGGYFGQTFKISDNNNTVAYFTASGLYKGFKNAPETTPQINPYYADKFELLGSFGFAKQNFFQGNMIYGYGRTEDIPYGFKTELTAGIEFSDIYGKRPYAGIEGRWGNMLKYGYLEASLKVSGYINRNQNTIEQGLIQGRIHHFTNLLNINRLHIRHFTTLNYTHGFNRFEGDNERLYYNEKTSGIHGISTEYRNVGINRLTLHSETVFFTPIYLYNFRFAFFTWADAGWLGMNNLFYKNKFNAAIGVGIRVKNEDFVFNNMQIRIGIGLMNNNNSFDHFDFTNEDELYIAPYAPTHAQTEVFE